MSLVEFRHWCHLGGETISKLLNSKREFKWWGDPAEREETSQMGMFWNLNINLGHCLVEIFQLQLNQIGVMWVPATSPQECQQ